MDSEELLMAFALMALTVGLATRRFSPTLGVVGCLLFLFVVGVGDLETAFGGFSNAAPITIAALCVVAGGVQRTGAFALAAITAASASFLTPIGYQTNTMVYGPGRYRCTDYLRLGVPLTVVVLVIVPLMAT